MKPGDDLPAEILSFLDAQVDSIEQLEVLRLLGENPAWNASALAQEAQVPPAAMLALLHTLQARGLLQLEACQGDLVCRHCVLSPDKEALLHQLLAVYRARPVSLIRRLYAQKS